MAFKTVSVGRSEGKTKDIDYDALNKYIIETCKLEERETLVGYVSVIADLGIQKQEDAEVKFNGTEEDERLEITKNPNTYFKNGIDAETKKRVRLKCWPQKAIQSVAFAVDFPDIILDKGQFFGDSNPLPLRLWLGGNFHIDGVGQVVGRPTPLKVVKNTEGKWTFSSNHLCYKMAVAAKIIKPGEVFVPERIDELLGQAFQFDVQVYMKENKGKEYLQEYVKFVGGLGRNQQKPEHVTTPYILQFDEPNKDEAVKELRVHIVNTIKRAANYENSAIKEQIERLRPSPNSTNNSASEEAKEPEKEPAKEEAKPKVEKKVAKTKTEPVKNTEEKPEEDNQVGDDFVGDDFVDDGCPF